MFTKSKRFDRSNTYSLIDFVYVFVFLSFCWNQSNSNNGTIKHEFQYTCPIKKHTQTSEKKTIKFAGFINIL